MKKNPYITQRGQGNIQKNPPPDYTAAMMIPSSDAKVITIAVNVDEDALGADSVHNLACL